MLGTMQATGELPRLQSGLLGLRTLSILNLTTHVQARSRYLRCSRKMVTDLPVLCTMRPVWTLVCCYIYSTFSLHIMYKGLKP
jgi:hypothetical protein